MKKSAVVLASIMVAACASSPNSVSQSNVNGASPTKEKSAAVAAAKIDLNQLQAEIQKLEKQSDYFDYNKFAVKPQYQNILRKEAEFIKSHKQDLVTLEGNADERGSEQYNKDLGSKRAIAVANDLEKLGVPANQIKMVSLGKDKPRLTCHLENCWKENRRVDFVHNIN
jgi:peptidoglycan-associated lipoprotein